MTPKQMTLEDIAYRLRQLAQEAETMATMADAMARTDKYAPARWYTTADNPPQAGQKVIVKTATGEQYFLTYPFSSVKYPKWWCIPEED